MPKVNRLGDYKNLALRDIKNPEKTLEKCKPFLKDWWISAGTAIGLYRDGDFIPTDTDIDIGVRTDKTKQPILLPLRLIRTVTFTDHEDNERYAQTAYYDDENDCIFDVFYYHDDINEGELVSWGESGIIRKPAFGIKELPTKYGMLPFMHPIEEYLEDRYGDWKTPSNGKYKYNETL